jgi:hypothetical protein
MHADKRKRAMSEEINSSDKKNALVSRPMGAHILKHNNCFKVRLSINGSRQKYNCARTFSPVIRYESVRTILAIAATEN